jgi:hypothetical protein
MTSSGETGQVTGTKDKDYNIIWFTEACLSNAFGWRATSRMPSATATPSWPTSSAEPRPRAARAPSRASSCCGSVWGADWCQLAGGDHEPARR